MLILIDTRLYLYLANNKQTASRVGKGSSGTGVHIRLALRCVGNVNVDSHSAL